MVRVEKSEEVEEESGKVSDELKYLQFLLSIVVLCVQ